MPGPYYIHNYFSDTYPIFYVKNYLSFNKIIFGMILIKSQLDLKTILHLHGDRH